MLRSFISAYPYNTPIVHSFFFFLLLSCNDTNITLACYHYFHRILCCVLSRYSIDLLLIICCCSRSLFFFTQGANHVVCLVEHTSQLTVAQFILLLSCLGLPLVSETQQPPE